MFNYNCIESYNNDEQTYKRSSWVNKMYLLHGAKSELSLDNKIRL